MGMIFPLSPTVNDVFTSGSRTYVWNGTAWIAMGSSVVDLTYIPSPGELLEQLSNPPQTIAGCIHALDKMINRLSSNAVALYGGLTGTDRVINVPEYITGSGSLSVFVDGIKLIPSTVGVQNIFFSPLIPIEYNTAHGLPSGTYFFDITVNGGSPLTQTISIVIPTDLTTQDFGGVVERINNRLGAQGVLAIAQLTPTTITFYSNILGYGSAVNITNDNLFISMSNFDMIAADIPGIDAAYDEDTPIGILSSTITIRYQLITNNNIFVVCTTNPVD